MRSDEQRAYAAKRARDRRANNPEVRKKDKERHRIHSVERPEQYLLNRARARATKLKLEFTITKDDIIIPKICPLLEIPIERKDHKLGRGRALPGSPSLDRIDSSVGYVKGNVRVISFRANTIKNDSTPDELKLMVRNIDAYVAM